jgi:cytoskeleton protein RodZ
MAEIGASLREARMRAKIEINEVEVRTKIRAKYLRAIENEEWDLLPGEVYAKSFLRTYGAYLGLDTRQLLDDFKRQYEAPTDHELRPIAPSSGRERERGPRGPIVPPWVAVAVVLVIVLAVLYIVGQGGGPSKPTTTTSKHVTHHRRHRARRHHRTVLGAGTVGTAGSKVKLQLIPTGQVYVCLVNGKGTQLIPGKIYSQGETVPVESAGKLLLTLGNAAVQMKVNGAPVPITASSGAIGYELLPGSHRLLPPAQQPRCA